MSTISPPAIDVVESTFGLGRRRRQDFLSLARSAIADGTKVVPPPAVQFAQPSDRAGRVGAGRDGGKTELGCDSGRRGPRLDRPIAELAVTVKAPAVRRAGVGQEAGVRAGGNREDRSFRDRDQRRRRPPPTDELLGVGDHAGIKLADRQPVSEERNLRHGGRLHPGAAHHDRSRQRDRPPDESQRDAPFSLGESQTEVTFGWCR